MVGSATAALAHCYPFSKSQILEFPRSSAEFWRENDIKWRVRNACYRMSISAQANQGQGTTGSFVPAGTA